jgi:hypothetical protein
VRTKPLAFLVIGLVTMAVLAWLMLRRDAASHPIAAGPGRAAGAQDARESHVDATTTDASHETAGAAEPADTRNVRAVADKTAPAESIVLYGYVRAAEGMSPPTEPAYVAVVDSQGNRVQGTASDEGAYSLSGLRPGHYRLTAVARPSAEAEDVVDLSLDETPTRHDITLSEKPSLLVKLVDHDGKPATLNAWLGAAATREPLGDWIDETPNQDPFGVGRFLNNGLTGAAMAVGCLGRIDLEIAPPVFVSLLHNQRVLATQHVEAGQREVVFVVDSDSPLLKTATVRARFVDQAGQEVPKLWATLNGGSSSRTAKSDAGALVWSALQPGWYRVVVYAKGVEQPDIECRVEPGEDKDLGTVTLAPEQWISGAVIEPQKESEHFDLSCDIYDWVAAANVSPYRYKSRSSFRTQTDGTFRIGGRMRGQYLLKYDSRDSSYGIWARIVDTRAGPVENVRVELVPGVPVLVHPSGKEWHGVMYKISDEAGVPYLESQLWGPDPRRISLAPGRYQVEVRVRDSETTRKTLAVGADQADLALP